MTTLQPSPHTNGRAQTYAEQRTQRLAERVNLLETILAEREAEIDALRHELNQIRDYTGTDVHIAAQEVAIKERDEMITGLRQTIKRLEGK